MKECQVTRLKDAPNFQFNLACGDSLLHGSPSGYQLGLGFHELDHHYQSENVAELRRILKSGQDHAVVANPPYITVKDKALNEAYRERYPEVCHRKYSLAVPFMQRLFDLTRQGGFTGQITANSFMKREFGKKLVESYLPKIDLTHVIDTSGAYLPGFGTPTVILFGQRRQPLKPTIRAVMGIKGEPSTPTDPSHGQVWTAITEQIDQPGSQSLYVSVNESPRSQFGKHPWSIGGGGASELKQLLDDCAAQRLGEFAASIGFGSILGEDDAFSRPSGCSQIRCLPTQLRRPLMEGELVRDWSVTWQQETLFPYDDNIQILDHPAIRQWLWRTRTLLAARLDFSRKTYDEAGRRFWEYHQIPIERNQTSLSIVFSAVATHNHFVLNQGSRVFKQSCPLIKLSGAPTEADYLRILGQINSSVACFWMKQVFHNKV
jgi:hypothetical protein